MPLDPAFARIRKIGHQLEGRYMGGQAESLILIHLDSINEQEFQQGNI